MYGAHSLWIDTNSLTTKLKQVLHCVGKIKIVNEIAPKPAIVYAQTVIKRVNEYDPKS